MKKAWKIYFIFMAILNIFSLFDFPRQVWMEIIFKISNLITLTALYGYCFNRKIWENLFWRFSFFVCALVEIIDCVTTNLFHRPLYSIGINIIAALIVVPIYIAMYLYAFKSNNIWEKPNREMPSQGSFPFSFVRSKTNRPFEFHRCWLQQFLDGFEDNLKLMVVRLFHFLDLSS